MTFNTSLAHSRVQTETQIMQDSNGNCHALQETTEEKDLGIWTDPSLKFSVHIGYAVKKANQILGLIR